MPKGETSRPYNRKEKQAAKRIKQRGTLAKKALAGGSSMSTVKTRVLETPGAKRDYATMGNERAKDVTRKLANKSEKEFLNPSPSRRRNDTRSGGKKLETIESTDAAKARKIKGSK